MTGIYFFIILVAIVLVLMSVEMLVVRNNILYVAAAILMFVFALTVGGHGLYGYLLTANFDVQSFLVIRTQNGVIHLIAPALFFLSCYFPRGEYSPLGLKWIGVIAFVFFGFAMVSFLGLDIEHHAFEVSYYQTVRQVQGIVINYKPVHWILFIIDGLFGAYALLAIILKYRKVQLIYQKKQIRYFLAAVALLIAVLAVVIASRGVLPAVIRMILFGVVSFVFGAVFLYSIVNYRFFNIRNTLRRLGKEFLFGALISLPIVLILYMIRQWSASIPAAAFFVLFTFALVIVNRLYETVYELIKTYVNTGRENKDFTSEIMDRIGVSRTKEEFAKSLCEAVMDKVNCRNAEFLILSDTKDGYECLYSGSMRTYRVERGEAFFKIITKDIEFYERELILIDPRYADIRSEAEDYFSRFEVSILIPLWFEKDLEALLNVSVKFDNTGWTPQELSIISRIKKAASIVLNSIIMNERDREVKFALRELDLASDIQNSIFQKEIPQFKRMDVSAYLKPMKWVSGDYYMVDKVSEDKLAFIVADVSGKGIPAALVAMMIHTVAKSQEFGSISTSAIVSKINDVMTSNIGIGGTTRIASFATIFCGLVDNKAKSLYYTNAGHFPLLSLDVDTDKVRWLKPNAKPAGIFREEMYPTEIYSFRANQIFVVYSDGITEMTDDKDEEFGDERLLEAVRKHKNESAKEIIDAILGSVEEFSDGKEQMDDMTLLVIKL